MYGNFVHATNDASHYTKPPKVGSTKSTSVAPGVVTIASSHAVFTAVSGDRGDECAGDLAAIFATSFYRLAAVLYSAALSLNAATVDQRRPLPVHAEQLSTALTTGQLHTAAALTDKCLDPLSASRRISAAYSIRRYVLRI